MCQVGGDTDFIYHILEHRQKQRYEPQKHQLCQRIQTSKFIKKSKKERNKRRMKSNIHKEKDLL